MARPSRNLKPALDMAVHEYGNGLSWDKAVDKAAQRHNLGPLDQDWLLTQKPSKTSPAKPDKVKP